MATLHRSNKMLLSPTPKLLFFKITLAFTPNGRFTSVARQWPLPRGYHVSVHKLSYKFWKGQKVHLVYTKLASVSGDYEIQTVNLVFAKRQLEKKRICFANVIQLFSPSGMSPGISGGGGLFQSLN